MRAAARCGDTIERLESEFLGAEMLVARRHSIDYSLNAAGALRRPAALRN